MRKFQLDLLERGLRKAGFIVYTTRGGSDARKLFATTTIAALLLDLTMPDTNGFAICSAVRKVGNVPIVMIAATDNHKDIEQSHRLGANGYIVKSFRPHEALSALTLACLSLKKGGCQLLFSQP